LIWFTGLSGSGKSTLAHTVEEELYRRKCRTFVFDGDNVRHGLCSDLGFSRENRAENLRRIGEMSKLFLDAGVISLAAFISPFKADRVRIKNIVGSEHFLEIFCSCPIEVCETRDIKGLYKRARAGEIKEFTGISSPYEEPEDPDLVLRTSEKSLEECTKAVINLLIKRNAIAPM
jgi:adenylylsulfate kinase